MALPGPPPQPSKRRRNIGPLDSAWVEVEDVPFRGPVPIKPPRGLHRNARRWLAVVSAVPHAVLWRDDDWAYIGETLIIKDAFENGDLKLAQELRSRYAKLGLTYEDRLKLRIRYVEPGREESATDQPPTVSEIGARRQRLRIAASD